MLVMTHRGQKAQYMQLAKKQTRCPNCPSLQNNQQIVVWFRLIDERLQLHKQI